MKHSMLWQKKLLILCGTGGVGKTTTSAALALRAALEGKRVGLITIDPAKRLANSLGLKKLSSEPQNLNHYIEKTLNKKIKGSLSALMLDSKDTLHKFLFTIGGKETLVPFTNSNLFQIISDNFSGSHDYLAMEKLYELHHSNDFDLIVLDTPPARHTLDFLDAPDKIARFFDDRIFSWFLTDARSNKIIEKIRAKGAKTALSVLEKLTGSGVLHDFVLLAPHIYKVKNSFVERQRKIQTLIRSDKAGALFVSSPTDLARGEAEPFLKDAEKQGITILALLVNRSLRKLAPITYAQMRKQAPDAAPELLENYQNLRFLVEEEEKNTKLLEKLAGTKYQTFSIAEWKEDIHDIHGLYALAQNF